MDESLPRGYQIHEFAKLTGLTVRALQHYDHLGLLKPLRSRAGHRTYSDQDLQILVQILALKSVGVPLKQIATLRRTGAPGLAKALHLQRAVLEKKKPLLDKAITAIRNVELALESGREADPEALRSLIEAVGPQDDAPAAVDTAPLRVEPAIVLKAPDRAELRRRWTLLLADVEQAADVDPSSAQAQALADRWIKLLELLAGSAAAIDAQLVKSANVLGSPGGRNHAGVTPAARAWEFVGKALAARAQEAAGTNPATT